jgi:Flp pilus assembly protein TadD
LRPNHAGTHNALGYVYIRLFRFREAEASFREAVRINPSFGCPHYGLAITYFALGEKDAFVREFGEGQRLHPRGAEIAKNWLEGLVRISQKLQQEKAAQAQK